ncbi:MAG: hypothetical protein MRZ40_02690 [Ligilactobacillus animalis]|uniref:hypothetical protein n=1 Tax=Ligilactobacillus animalis TaxID=1605 RepID=UPI00242A336A|nr:hypothetical protein [Ligilactobacillus animalis]MCI5941460.1 hypothetical protein [Ligilactobacillus animalis]MDY2992927.1 hypothetical protein [Ligilactobacillus animalis]
MGMMTQDERDSRIRQLEERQLQALEMYHTKKWTYERAFSEMAHVQKLITLEHKRALDNLEEETTQRMYELALEAGKVKKVKKHE